MKGCASSPAFVVAATLLGGLMAWSFWLWNKPSELASVPPITSVVRNQVERQSPSSVASSLAAKSDQMLPDRAEAMVLLDQVQMEKDPAQLDAAQWTLAGMADAPLIAEIARRYEQATTQDSGQRLATIIGRVRRAGLAAELASLAPATVPVRDFLASAALRALRQIGTPYAVSAFARRLDVADESDASLLAESMARFDQPGLQEELIDIASGKHDASSLITRIAALQALGNYHDNLSRGALESLGQDPDLLIAESARKALQRSR